ncbi:MAG: TerD family protein, partial [Oscillospiraceae bacterium]|nr:TerD family protein [Oscillospiraceae bacterium]
SVYSGSTDKNFSLVRNSRLSLYAQDKERVRFDLEGLSGEVTIVAAEFYIYKGEWRISAVGSGFRDGLAKLCNRYGIEVSG